MEQNFLPWDRRFRFHWHYVHLSIVEIFMAAAVIVNSQACFELFRKIENLHPPVIGKRKTQFTNLIVTAAVNSSCS